MSCPFAALSGDNKVPIGHPPIGENAYEESSNKPPPIPPRGDEYDELARKARARSKLPRLHPDMTFIEAFTYSFSRLSWPFQVFGAIVIFMVSVNLMHGFHRWYTLAADALSERFPENPSSLQDHHESML